MLTQYVGLTSQTVRVDLASLTRVAGALQKQISRDFAPAWEVKAVVSAFASLNDLPLGYWPIVIKDNINFQGAAGIHLDKDGQPFALVQYSNRWSLTASHELAEMLADPFGNRLVAGDGIEAYEELKGRDARVEYLVEVCDPSEAEQFGYTVNGELVSDFYTPRYFDPVVGQGVQYSFTGAITEPRQILEGGYLAWHDPVDDHWYRGQRFDGPLVIEDLGIFSAAVRSLRAEVDKRTFRADMMRSLPEESPMLVAAHRHLIMGATARSAKADALQAQIDSIVVTAAGGTGNDDADGGDTNGG